MLLPSFLAVYFIYIYIHRHTVRTPNTQMQINWKKIIPTTATMTTAMKREKKEIFNMPSFGPLNWTLFIVFNVQCLCIHTKYKHCVWKYDKSILNLSCCVSIIAGSQSTIEFYILYWMCLDIWMAMPRKTSKSIGFIIFYTYCTLYMDVLCACLLFTNAHISICRLYTQPTANGHRILQAYFIFQFPILHFIFIFVFFFSFGTRHSAFALGSWIIWLKFLFILLMILYVQIFSYAILLHSALLSICRIRQHFN